MMRNPFRKLLRDPLIGRSPRDPDTGQVPDNPVEETFARWTWGGARLAFFGIAGAFALYVSGALAPRVPIAEVERRFHLSAADFLAETGGLRPWSGLGELGTGDGLSLAALVFTGAVTALAYLATLVALLRQRDWLYAFLAVLQVAVFAWAAVAR